MKILLRFLLLGFFAAVGVALAVGVGVSLDPSAEGPKPPASNLVAWATTPDDPKPPADLHSRVGQGREGDGAASQIAQPSLHVLRGTTSKLGAEVPPMSRLAPLTAPDGQTFDLAPRPLASLPSGPLLVEPEPRIGQQLAPELSKQGLEYLRRQLAAPRSPPAGAAPPAAAAAPAAAAPAPNGIPGLPATAPAKSGRRVVKADPEGNGKLTIHIPPGSELREVLDLLGEQGGLNILAGNSVQGKVSATLTGVDIDSALDAILKSTGYVMRRQGKFIFVGKPEEFNSLEQAMDRIGTRVYRPNYVTAAELKALVTPLLTEKLGVVSVSSPTEVGIATNNAAAGGNSYAGGDVVLVRDYEAVLAQIDQMVAEVDVRPLQVHIEAMILSVKLADTDQFGVNFQLLKGEDHVRFGWGTPPNLISDIKFDKGGLKFGYLDGNLAVFLEALEQIADTNVIANPRLMVMNKHRAEILIGEKKGYVSTTITETASSQAVEFLDVGAQLRLRPFISRDGLIRMEVHPELSDGNVETVNGFTLPNKEVTEVTTNIMVRDGCTVIIGGLIKEQLTATTSAVPLLGSLPWVGPLFRNTKQTTEKREVIVLITPRIVYEPGTCQEGAKVACEFERRQATYAEKMSPLNRRSIARRYLRLANSAWAAGDQNTALRFAEMAVHFDPLSREAIDLRSNIWQGRRGGCAGQEVAGRSAAAMMDGPAIDGRILDDLQHGPAAGATMLHPLDPGQPGLNRDIVRPRRLQ